MKKILLIIIIIGLIFTLGCQTEPIKNYVSEDPEECERTQILCVEGFEFFSDETGCGCQEVSQ